MKTALILYLAAGFFSYWPLVWHYRIEEQGKWYEWIAAWAVWTICWPYRYIQDAVYWWRAKK